MKPTHEKHWKTLRRKTVESAMLRAVDAVADLIEVIHARDAKGCDVQKLQNIMYKIAEHCNREE